jgi:polyhydroxybutyrate depolymerase
MQRSFTSRALALVALLATLAGCSRSDSADVAPDTTTAPPTTSTTPPAAPPTSTTTVAAPVACTPGAGYEPGTARHTINVDGRPREFLVHLPPRPAERMALVVNFHGAGSDMQEQSVYAGFDALADEDGFVVATPNGVDAAIRQWRFVNGDEHTFVRALVAELVANACVDAERVFATGISSGGAMSAGLACLASDVFHGFAPVAANFYVPAVCADATPRPIVIFHGTDDVAVPYGGGRVNAGAAGNGLSTQGSEVSAAAWAKHNGCDPEPTVTEQSPEVVEHSWSGCDEPVVLYEIVGGGHTWPGAFDVPRLGAVTDEISATETIVDSFIRRASTGG